MSTRPNSDSALSIILSMNICLGSRFQKNELMNQVSSEKAHNLPDPQKPPDAQSRVSKEKYIQNLEKIVETLKARKCGVILMTPNQMCWTQRLKGNYSKPPYVTDDPDGFNVTLREYAQAVRELAEKQKVPLVDVYAAYTAYGKVEKQSVNDLLLDGMHPNDKGHRIVADLLIPEIVKLCNAKAE